MGTPLARDKKHPREFGFRLGLTARVSGTGQIEAEWQPEVKKLRDLVYVAVRSDGTILKVGETGGTLRSRWSGILRLIAAAPEQRRYRANEWKARDKWRGQVLGRSFEVWCKPPDLVRLEYCGIPMTVRSRQAEEAFLDCYCHPLIGKTLGQRNQEL
jgi:hypothetical protein